jgi:hypothetical protein
MALQSTSSGDSTDFALFQSLLEELQLMIWEKALPGPRFVELEYCNKVSSRGDWEGYFTSIALYRLSLQSVSIPARKSSRHISYRSEQKAQEPKSISTRRSMSSLSRNVP